MAEVKLYPDLVWLFSFFNLAAWYFKGNPLFSWWYLVLIGLFEITVAGLLLAFCQMEFEG